MYEPSGSIAISWMEASASGIWEIKTITIHNQKLKKNILSVPEHEYHDTDTADTFTFSCKVRL
jgi:hypothetical protein